MRSSKPFLPPPLSDPPFVVALDRVRNSSHFDSVSFTVIPRPRAYLPAPGRMEFPAIARSPELGRRVRGS